MRHKFFIVTIISFLPFSVYSVEVSKSDWVNAMSTALPTHFCKPKSFFRQCYSVTATECELVAASATRICLNKNKNAIPNTLEQPKDGTHWGTIVGKCAGEAYSNSFSTKYIKNIKCSNVNNWK